MRGIGALASAVVAILLAAGGVLAADEMQEPVRLAYRAGDGCPDAASFEARVRARTERAVFVTATDAARTFEVDLEAGPPPRGKLTVRRHGVVEGDRDVQAETCADVADALALVAALAIDPAASIAAHPAGGAAASAAAAGSSTAVPPVVPAAPGPSTPPEPPPAALAPPAREAPVSGPRSLPRTLFVGADAAVATGVAPGALAGVSPRVGWRFRETRLLAPSVSVAFLRAASGTSDLAAGDASFTWTVGRVDGCAVSWPPGRAHLLGCLRAEAGELEGVGSQIAGAQTARRGWLAFGPLVRAEWELLPPLFVELDAAAMVRAMPDTFYFQPKSAANVIETIPYVGLEASAGLGVHFL